MARIGGLGVPVVWNNAELTPAPKQTVENTQALQIDTEGQMTWAPHPAAPEPAELSSSPATWAPHPLDDSFSDDDSSISGKSPYISSDSEPDATG
jgi:hypothetical protein